MNSIAVLPFANLSPDADDEYFADGITDEIISSLSRLDDLKIISRSSAFHFKGQAVVAREIGDRLGVENILEGSLRKVGEKLRINAQLIQVNDDVLMWSKRFDKEVGDIFDIQDEIAESIVEALSDSLSKAKSDLQLNSHKENVAAYEKYLLGMYHWNKRTEERALLAKGAFEAALEIEPEYALAHSGLSLAYRFLFSQGYDTSAEILENALSHAEKALEIDESLAEAHISLAMFLREHKWEWERAKHHSDRAVELKPGYALAHGTYAEYMRCIGRFDESIKARRKAIELDPLNINNFTALCYQYYLAGDYKGGMDAARHVLAISPDYPFIKYYMGLLEIMNGKPDIAFENFISESVEWRRRCGTILALHQIGNKKDAKSELEKFIKDYGAAGAYQIGMLCIQLEDFDAGFEWLNKSMEHRDGGISDAKFDPLLKPAHGDPRMEELLAKLDLPE
jgi:TolB-like protein/Tfp pilus assembly protein PilF